MAEVILGRIDAQALEAAEAAHLAGQLAVAAAFDPSIAARALPLDGGVAILSDPAFGRKLNHAVGLGMAGPVDPAQLDAVESAFDARGAPVEIDVCPLADPSAMSALAERGYIGSAFSNTYWRAPASAPGDASAATGLVVRRAKPTDAQAFIEASVQGFSATPSPRSSRLLTLLPRGALLSADVTALIAEIDGHVAGTAAVRVIAVGGRRVAHLFMASTVERFRGRGVQPALLDARLAVAAQLDADIVSLCARPLNASARNAERAGFRLAYTKTTFVRPSVSNISDNIS